MDPTLSYRAGVGAIIITPKREVIQFKRTTSTEDPFIPHPWQFIQGGLEKDEDHYLTLKRELNEEAGLKEAEWFYLDETPFVTAYELGPSQRGGKYGRGQVHKWFLIEVPFPTIAIDLTKSEELSEWRVCATPYEALIDCTPFKRRIYLEVMRYFRLI